jgi:hypothetical protein
MKQVIELSIDVSKIEKGLLYKSPKTNRTYLNIAVLIRDEKDQYGNDGFVTQKVPQGVERDKGPILGNAKIKERPGTAPAPQAQAKPAADNLGWDEPDPIPF